MEYVLNNVCLRLFASWSLIVAEQQLHLRPSFVTSTMAAFGLADISLLHNSNHDCTLPTSSSCFPGWSLFHCFHHRPFAFPLLFCLPACPLSFRHTDRRGIPIFHIRRRSHRWLLEEDRFARGRERGARRWDRLRWSWCGEGSGCR